MGLFGLGKTSNNRVPESIPSIPSPAEKGRSCKPISPYRQPGQTQSVLLDLNKAPQTAGLLDLRKSAECIEKVVVDLDKKCGSRLTDMQAKVAVVLDTSGSMSRLYNNGDVQRTINRFLPLAMRVDDNKQVDVWIFDECFRRLPSMNLDNYDGYIQREIFGQGIRLGSGTSYAPPIEDILNYYYKGNEADSSEIPVFVIFITDGSNDDEKATDAIIRESAQYNTFIQFFGIGHSSFTYLRKLDDLSGRACDNTGFIAVNNIISMPEDQMFTAMLDQYPDWLKAKGVSV